MKTFIIFLISSAFVFGDEPVFGTRPERVDVPKLKSDFENAKQTIEDQKVAIDNLRTENEVLKRRLAELENIPGLFLSGFADIKSRNRPPFIQIRTSAGCIPCKQLIDNINRAGIATGPGEEIEVVNMTAEEWAASRLSIPDVRLVINGEESEPIAERNPQKLRGLVVQARAIHKTETTAQQENLAGLKIGTLPIKAQVEAMLPAMDAFLDGGTLSLTYTPKPGVIKEYLTIKRGVGGIKIPAKTSLTLGMKNGGLDIKFSDPKPVVIAGPLERGLQEIEVTLTRLSLRLPWMIDPEFGYK
jgi:hypothetical protein